MKSNQRVFACTECRLGDIELDRCDEGACTNCGASIPREQLDKLALLEDHFRTFMKSLTECIDELDLTASPDPAAAAELEALFIDPPGAHALSDRHHLYYQVCRPRRHPTSLWTDGSDPSEILLVIR